MFWRRFGKTNPNRRHSLSSPYSQRASRQVSQKTQQANRLKGSKNTAEIPIHLLFKFCRQGGEGSSRAKACLERQNRHRHLSLSGKTYCLSYSQPYPNVMATTAAKREIKQCAARAIGICLTLPLIVTSTTTSS